MRPLVLSLAFLLIIASNPSPSSPAQAATSAVPSPTALLQQSLAALVGNTTLSDITLTGSAHRIAGSDDETGTATLQAVANGSSRLQLSLPSGMLTEIANLFSAPAGTWSGPDAVSHPQAYHNLLAENAWFSPALAISRRLSNPTYLATYVGVEALNGQPVQHISICQTASYPDPPGGPTYAHLTQVDFYLDSTTLLPAAISFNAHPDNNALLDMPVEVLFSDYQAVSSVKVPMHFQEFINNTLAFDFQIQSASVNSGISAQEFAVR